MATVAFGIYQWGYVKVHRVGSPLVLVYTDAFEQVLGDVIMTKHLKYTGTVNTWHSFQQQVRHMIKATSLWPVNKALSKFERERREQGRDLREALTSFYTVQKPLGYNRNLHQHVTRMSSLQSLSLAYTRLNNPHHRSTSGIWGRAPHYLVIRGFAPVVRKFLHEIVGMEMLIHLMEKRILQSITNIALQNFPDSETSFMFFHSLSLALRRATENVSLTISPRAVGDSELKK